MQIKTEDIRNGGHVGEVVWICHYNRPDLNKKALRNIPPTKVIVVSNKDLPSGKSIYYSENHFSPIGKNGSPTAKIISPVDNTGFRSHIGNELFVFTDENECFLTWNSQIQECCDRIEVEIQNATKVWELEKNKVEGLKV